MDETGISTVQNPGKVVTSTGKKQVGSTSSQERGELTTMCCAINASGNHLSPFYIFPRVFMKGRFMNGCVPGSKGIAAKSGYMNSDIFSDEYLPFFMSSIRCTKQEPVLLILDNHASHISLKAVEVCKANGVHLLTLPPHCSHKLQPLDRCIYGPLKKFLGQAMDDWMRCNPGKCVTIYEMSQLSSLAFTKSMTPENILSGFRCTGIYPLNSLIFADHEFAPSSVTDQPPPLAEFDVLERSSLSQSPSTSATPQIAAATHSLTPTSQPPTTDVTPEQILPLPKAKPHKPSKKRKVKSAILTDTPEKQRLEKEIQDRAVKKPRVANKKKSKKKRFPIQPAGSSSEEELVQMVLDSDSDCSIDNDSGENDHISGNINPGSFVVVKYETDKKSHKFYVGKITFVKDDCYKVKFMRKVKSSAASFIFPEVEDLDDVSFDDIILNLGDPISVAGTHRAASKVMFRVDLSDFSIE